MATLVQEKCLEVLPSGQLGPRRRVLDQLKVPYFVVLGNHDLSRVPHGKKDLPVTLSKYTVAGAYVGRSGGMVPGMTYYSHSVMKDLVLVSLDASRAQSSRRKPN